MVRLKKILVGIDGLPSDIDDDERTITATAQEAAILGVRLAASSRAELTFLTVVDAADDETADVTSSQELLQPLVDEAARLQVTARAQVARGEAGTDIIKEVIRHRHQMVIVGSCSPSDASGMLLGDAISKLLRNCPCPVWVVRSDRAPEVSTIVVADDLSPVGERCLDLGVSAARLLDARLLVVHSVFESLKSSFRHAGATTDDRGALQETARHDAEKTLQHRLEAKDYRTISRGVRLEVADGRPDRVIEDAIAEHSADVLVMGTISRGGSPGHLVGDTAERLLPRLNCSLIAVKPDDFLCPIQTDG